MIEKIFFKKLYFSNSYLRVNKETSNKPVFPVYHSQISYSRNDEFISVTRTGTV